MIYLETFRREDGLYDYRIVEEGNGETLCGSQQGFASEGNADRGIANLLDEMIRFLADHGVPAPVGPGDFPVRRAT